MAAVNSKRAAKKARKAASRPQVDDAAPATTAASKPVTPTASAASAASAGVSHFVPAIAVSQTKWLMSFSHLGGFVFDEMFSRQKPSVRPCHNLFENCGVEDEPVSALSEPIIGGGVADLFNIIPGTATNLYANQVQWARGTVAIDASILFHGGSNKNISQNIPGHHDYRLMRGYVNNPNLPQPPAQGNANVPAPAVAQPPLPGHLDPQLYADYVGLCLFRLARAGFIPLLVLGGFRNFKESANNAGNVPLNLHSQVRLGQVRSGVGVEGTLPNTNP